VRDGKRKAEDELTAGGQKAKGRRRINHRDTENTERRQTQRKTKKAENE
jgi:hypothetical protein